jgi:transposase
MSNLYWLSEAQMERLRPYFPKSRGRARVDDRRVLSGIIFINRNGLRWCDAPSVYGPPKTLYNRWKRWSDMGVFAPPALVKWRGLGTAQRPASLP